MNKKKFSITPILLIALLVLMFTGNIGFLQGPLTNFMQWAEHSIGGVNAVGWSIVMLTVVVRLVLMPMMVQQQHAATVQQEKMRLLQPQLAKVQEAQKNATTQEEKMKASQAMMAVYQKNGVSMFGGMNFTTLIIQWPIFIGLYDAIKGSPELAHASFFGISLAEQSPFLAIATGVIYMVQAYLSMIGIPAEQKKAMQTMMYIMPVMMFFMTWVTNAGIALYFLVGALIMIVQTIIIVVWRPRIRAGVANSFVVVDVADDALAGRVEVEQTGAFATAMKKAQEQQAAQSQEAPKDITNEVTEEDIRRENQARKQKNNQ
ncbi:membrane protein insertase YidC [Weissella ceti]|uniref:Membrane protein insertase YidC n=1 Tax=Weissella ceti TaxID=759620 RepID=A0ABT3E5Q5_9LACO|nr:membrane protein insertase YidC [Weissella ceti]MCW0953744.1 membrane protein insertase YidC [Weissella ceti]QVK11423.1 membrane protein insertase YidC [Weissella ceti]